jgi:dTMP kinase
MIEGHFIVVEGVDGAGTTTQVARLTEALGARGLPVRQTHEPSPGPVGVLIRQILAGRLVVPGISGPRPSSWTTMALLFAADRMDHLEATILPCLHDGVTVISDRYDHSSVAYQSVTSGEDAVETARWVRTLNREARRPDLVIVLDVPPEVAAKRRQGRNAHREIYDEQGLQRALAAFYADIETHFPEDRIVHVDATADVDTVAAHVLAAVDALRAEG